MEINDGVYRTLSQIGFLSDRVRLIFSKIWYHRNKKFILPKVESSDK